jgi:hypothetical protein
MRIADNKLPTTVLCFLVIGPALRANRPAPFQPERKTDGTGFQEPAWKAVTRGSARQADMGCLVGEFDLSED